MSETLNTGNNVNKKLPSGYYIINNNEIVSGSDCFIRDCVGKSVTKVPPIIIHTRTKDKDIYSSNKNESLDNTKVTKILKYYHKIIDKKEYSYDFSKFYYIENEGGKGPSKVVLHNKDFDYNGYIYNKNEKKLIKNFSGNLDNDTIQENIQQFVNIEKISFNQIDNNLPKFYINVTNNDNGTLSFQKETIQPIGGISIWTLLKITNNHGNQKCHICFWFSNFVVENKIDFSINNNISIKVSANYYKPIKEIGTITKPENYQYGIYRLRRNGSLYDVNKYIALKFDEFAALPTNITNFYTREPTSNHNDPDTIATLLNNPEGGTPSDTVPNIIQPTEIITEVYAIKHY